MVKDCHANDSILVRSAGSDYKWDDDAFKDIFDQPKLKLQQLFNHENLQDAEITIEENTNRSKAAEIASKQHSLSKGQMLHDDLFNESYGTLTKKRLSNIMDTIPDTYSKDSLGFTWPNTKSSSGAAVSIGVFNSYPDDIDFVEGSVSELSSDFQNNGDSLNDVQKADFGHQNQSISEMSERIPRIESRLMNWAHSELETVEEIENTNVDGLKIDHNKISSLSRVPNRIRYLQAANNKFSSLQSIVQLSSLTFLDISSNNLQDISGKFNLNNEISELLSLKDLCIDENKVNDLSPVFGLYNLKSLSARNNRIEKLDFEFANLHRLESLNCKGNSIASVKFINHLDNLVTLCFDDNVLSSFQVNGELKKLSSLSMNDNTLSFLLIDSFPSLSRLSVDRNPLNTIRGYESCSNLNYISADSLPTGKLKLDKESPNSSIKELCLSSVSEFFIHPTVMNNITFLDLSDCALDKIPNCLSSAPNLTFLSLENNKICDLSNLEANTKIKTLQLSGNLVCNLKETAQLIGRMDELQVLDVRNNRFIPSAISNSQLNVLKMVLRVSLIIANENLLVLDQERISSAERKVARKRMEILRKYASNFSQRLNEGESFSEWKPILHPVQDMTVDDDLVLEIVH